MNTTTATLSTVAVAMFALVSGFGASTVIANDLVPAKFQSDAQISVWVDNASLNLFVSQLAEITGRDAMIEGELQGQVSGRFNGSMIDTLNAVGGQFPVLFDLEDSTLGAVAESERTNATIALGEIMLDDQIKASLMDSLLPGNRVEMREGEVVVSGHPSFVSRVAKVVTLAVARTEPVTAMQATSIDGDQSVSINASVATDVSASVLPPSQSVIDTAAQQMLNEESDELTVAEQTEPASTNVSQSREIRWVTDIPGYETF